MKFLKISLIVSVVVGLFLLKIYFFPSAKSSTEQSKDGKANSSVADAEIVQLIDFETIKEFPGELLSNKETEISSERAGKIIGIFFNEGNNVEKGKLLVKLNDAGLQSQLKKLKVNEEYLSVTEERKKNLLKINGISQQEYDATLADLNNTRAEIEYLNTQIDETEIKAPFTGKLGLMNIADGAYLTPGKPIVTIQQTDPLKLEFYVPEKNLSEFKIGDLINFNCLNKDHYAKIYAINSKVESDTRQIQIRATVSNSKGELTPGADVTVRLKLKPKEKSILIPTESLISSARGKKVYLFKSGKAEEIQVVCGIRTADKIEITKGLNIGDTLITSGITQIRKGAPVKVKLKK